MIKTYSIQEINKILNGTILGNTSHQITAPEELELAKNTEISFIGGKKYEKLWET